MRRLTTTVLLVCAAIAACAGPSARDTGVRVYVNSRARKLNPPTMIRNGTAYLGLRGVAKALGASTRWNEKSKIAIVTLGNKRARVAQSKGVTVDGVLFVPLRLTGEALGCSVEWDGRARAIRITTEGPCPIGGG
jgi:uncharacterized protein